LNIVLFSGRAYGVEAASQYVFGKSAADLESWEAATLAGMVQSPTRFNPARNPEEATERRNLVLNAMKEPQHRAVLRPRLRGRGRLAVRVRQVRRRPGELGG
ncbi:transglycosylase domain-containing protein, partial [Corynebacterium diphtheriae]|uniref:transglycosylase domain-containing protein n=1 Tax=Corynebacterium diphtheriae TaxID=1717 RepID=UPI00210968A5